MVTKTMRGVDFGIDTEHVGNVRSFNKALIEHFLPSIIEFIG